MAVTTTPTTHDALRNTQPYYGNTAAGNVSRVGSRWLEAMIAARLDAAPGGSLPQLYKTTVTLADGTAQVAVAQAGVLYGMRVQHGGGVTGTADINLRVSMADNDRLVLACLCGFEEDTAVVCFGGDGAVGVSWVTDLRVRGLVSSDGTSAAATVNRATVELYYSLA